jgi:SAM-dependent methyltransferase
MFDIGGTSEGLEKSPKDVYDTLYSEADYDDPIESNNAIKWEIILKLLSGLEYKTVVDLGCGRGYYSKKFIEMGKDVIGVELSSVCCTKHLNDLPHVCSSIENFSIQNNKVYDLVLCMDVLEHIAQDKIEALIGGIGSLSNTAIYGVARHKDVILGFDLHLIIEDTNWWEDILKRFYKNVEIISLSERFFFFKCKDSNMCTIK